MIKIRLRRQGAKHRPSYRIVAAHDRSPRGGKVIEEVGLYEPLTDPATVRLNVDRARYWISVGAKPSSDTVIHILQRGGVLAEDGKLVPVPGTLADPLTRTIAELIRDAYPELARSTPRTIEFAGRLADYARALSSNYPSDPTNTDELDSELMDWIRQYVASEYPSSAVQAAEAAVVSSHDAAD